MASERVGAVTRDEDGGLGLVLGAGRAAAGAAGGGGGGCAAARARGGPVWVVSGWLVVFLGVFGVGECC